MVLSLRICVNSIFCRYRSKFQVNTVTADILALPPDTRSADFFDSMLKLPGFNFFLYLSFRQRTAFMSPLPAGFTYVHYNDIAELESNISDKTAAVMLETIQGEGGVYTPDADYLQQVRALCDKHDALLILDEIQAGIGRSGKFFAYENYGIKPDIVTLAKGLAGGVPIGAFIVTDKVAAAFKPGDHGTTFGGNPLACAAANVVLDTVPQEDFLKNVQAVGKYFKDKLQELAKKYPKFIMDVRGEGLILGAELKNADHGRDIVNDCLAKGLIINCTAGKVLRFIPPLIITTAQIDEAFAVMDEVIGKYAV